MINNVASRRSLFMAAVAVLVTLAASWSVSSANPSDPPQIRYVQTSSRNAETEARWDISVGAYRLERMRFRTDYAGRTVGVEGRKRKHVVRVGYRGHPWGPKSGGGQRHRFFKLIRRQLGAKGSAHVVIRAISPQGEDVRRFGHLVFDENYVCHADRPTCEPE